MDLSRTVTEINGDLHRKPQICTRAFCALTENSIPCELGIGARGQKKLESWCYRAEKEV